MGYSQNNNKNTLTPREVLMVKIQRRLSDLSVSQLRTVATAIDDGGAAGIADDLGEMELYELIIKYIRGEKLRSLEDEGMSQLQLLDDLVSGLLSTNDPDPDQPSRPNNAGKILAIAGAVVGGVGAVLAAPFVLGAVGFTSAGIAAGSIASSMMSAAAVANGGGVAAGSLVAILQSAGAAGLSASATAAVVGAGGSLGAGVGLLASKLQQNKKDENDDDDGDDDEDKKGGGGKT